MGILLSKYSKKRQNDLTQFAILIILVIYISHIMACIWLYLGAQEGCITSDESENCIKSWRYNGDFYDKPIIT